MKIYGYVEKGMGKTECQDRVLIGDTIQANGFLEVESDSMDNIVVAVADGIGGYAGGEKASLLAVDGLRVLNRKQQLQKEDIRALMENINQDIVRTGNSQPGMSDMSTTLTALIMNREKAISVHVGNCRLCTHKLYLRRRTTDHTVVEEQLRRREITREEAWVSPVRNQINACLGGNDGVYFEKLEIAEQDDLLQQQNNIILTCDGIHDYVNESEMEELLGGEGTAEQIVESLVKRARENGSQDDISIILIDRLERYGGKRWI